jgi:proton-coupled amino acid transporter
VFGILMYITTPLIILVGITGYMAFGDEIKYLIIFNLPQDKDFYIMIKVMFVIVVAFTYPLKIYPMVSIL